MTNQILALREHLIGQQVSLVVMEATGDYWKPFYYLLEGAGFEVMLVNARESLSSFLCKSVRLSYRWWLIRSG